MDEREAGIHSSLARRQQRAEERTRARRRRALVWVVRVLAIVVVFFLGIAVGRAIENAPRAGGTETGIRRLSPARLPAVTRTVTVTSSTP
jgi:hypothetical protein